MSLRAWGIDDDKNHVTVTDKTDNRVEFVGGVSTIKSDSYNVKVKVL